MFKKQDKRPCECGCEFEDHKTIEFKDGKVAWLYCRKCPRNLMNGRNSYSVRWCYNYCPIDNLKYIEWLYEQSN